GKASSVATVSRSRARAMALPLLSAVPRDVRAERAQRSEDALVVRVVRTQREAVALGDGDRHLEDVDRIEAETLLAEQPGLRIDGGGRQVEVKHLYQHLCEFALEVRDRVC